LAAIFVYELVVEDDPFSLSFSPPLCVFSSTPSCSPTLVAAPCTAPAAAPVAAPARAPCTTSTTLSTALATIDFAAGLLREDEAGFFLAVGDLAADVFFF
jgi:hypothetical protein